jgi:hypothetical protein
MNYLKIYKDLIRRAKNRITNKKLELHHIIPRSLFPHKIAHKTLYGDENLECVNDVDNVVYLTLREHVVAHAILVKIFYKVDKNCYNRMLYAANMMKCRGNSRKYEWLKKKFSKIMSDELTGKPSRAKGKKWSKESKENKSKNHYMSNKTYEEIFGVEKSLELKNIRENPGKH